jgi:molecular chaperone GrpE (heat shock protein)
LPVLDRLDELSATYQTHSFGKQFNALPGTMRAAMVEMGVQEYSVSVGDVVDTSRMDVVESQHSDTAAANTVLQVVTGHGLELDGNVLRIPQVVASLGPEPKVAGAADGDSNSDGSETASGETDSE